ncbi:SprT family zinc-dependent metalloprotease [Thermodesulfobium sp. 4217-1]|uniref:M48 family metallopeptidase n=1 Tax=Thermodesulfobium sp. 4217-1 TaxID=3120013 RepID=UPI003221BCF9
MSIKIDKILRSKRRTISLQIIEGAKLVVKAPYYVTDVDIDKVVEKYAEWIERKKSELIERNSKVLEKKFCDGEEFFYLGNLFKLKVADFQAKPIIFNNGFYIAKNHLPQAKSILTNWYKNRAREIFSERATFYSHLTGLKFNKLRISSAKTNWGSCSYKNTLSLSWRLIMAPIDIIDYVVVHEIIHIIIKNHSKEFWSKVEGLVPNYKEKRKWLKEFGHELIV